MSRTATNNLDYFPLDVGFIQDSRIKRLRAKFGSDGPLYYLYVLMRCYGEKGYYVELTEDFQEDAAADLGCSIEKIGLMNSYLLNKSLLDDTLFSTITVLSSHGIQSQYQKSVKSLRRDIDVDGRIWILEKEETEPFIKVRSFANKSSNKGDKSCKKDDKSSDYDTNKIKGNKIKLNESKGNESAASGELSTEFSTAPAVVPPGSNSGDSLTHTELNADESAILRLLLDGDKDRANKRYAVAKSLNYDVSKDRIQRRYEEERRAAAK